MPIERNYNLTDQLCLHLDQVLQNAFGKTPKTQRNNPAAAEVESHLTEAQRKHSAGLMRVNHAGEVSAQALYHAQGLASRSKQIKQNMQQAALEEGDHLAWCAERLTELQSRPSLLNPLWYSGSFIIGLAAGLIGDEWSLGFLAETESQVVNHLENHLKVLPENDLKSLKIIEQMRLDEAEHRDEALSHGAKPLPRFIQKLMRLTSKVMVKTAYWI